MFPIREYATICYGKCVYNIQWWVQFSKCFFVVNFHYNVRARADTRDFQRDKMSLVYIRLAIRYLLRWLFTGENRKRFESTIIIFWYGPGRSQTITEFPARAKASWCVLRVPREWIYLHRVEKYRPEKLYAIQILIHDWTTYVWRLNLAIILYLYVKLSPRVEIVNTDISPYVWETARFCLRVVANRGLINNLIDFHCGSALW